MKTAHRGDALADHSAKKSALTEVLSWKPPMELVKSMEGFRYSILGTLNLFSKL